MLTSIILNSSPHVIDLSTLLPHTLRPGNNNEDEDSGGGGGGINESISIQAKFYDKLISRVSSSSSTTTATSHIDYSLTYVCNCLSAVTASSLTDGLLDASDQTLYAALMVASSTTTTTISSNSRSRAATATNSTTCNDNSFKATIDITVRKILAEWLLMQSSRSSNHGSGSIDSNDCDGCSISTSANTLNDVSVEKSDNSSRYQDNQENMSFYSAIFEIILKKLQNLLFMKIDEQLSCIMLLQSYLRLVSTFIINTTSTMNSISKSWSKNSIADEFPLDIIDSNSSSSSSHSSGSSVKRFVMAASLLVQLVKILEVIDNLWVDVKVFIQGVNDGAQKVMMTKELLSISGMSRIHHPSVDHVSTNSTSNGSSNNGNGSSNSKNVLKKIKYLDAESVKIRSVLESAVVVYELRLEVMSYFYAIRDVRSLLGHAVASTEELFEKSLSVGYADVDDHHHGSRLSGSSSSSVYDHEDDQLEDKSDIASIKLMLTMLSISSSSASSSASSSLLMNGIVNVRRSSCIVNNLKSSKRSLLLADLCAREREFIADYEAISGELDSFVTATTSTAAYATPANSASANATTTSVEE